ncbi:hypothetical protein jhhlp_001222 [Lomentospora prolificans]|uniref:Uncharacterized protein n=1 Tax=Lomentospora prolificans TaxID=41688 RepID=A0A2N3NHN3_9PEZI|nr:hypothetical protein jhhlp_001222 [Lomentospora prolificans]
MLSSGSSQHASRHSCRRPTSRAGTVVNQRTPLCTAAAERTCTEARPMQTQSQQQQQQPPRGSVQRSSEPSKLDHNQQGIRTSQPDRKEAPPAHEPPSSPLSTSSRESLADTSSAASSNRSSVITAPDTHPFSDESCPSRTATLSPVEIPTISISPVSERRTSFSQIVGKDSLASSADSPTDTHHITSSFLKPLTLGTATPTITNTDSQAATTTSWWKLGLGIKDMALTGDSRPRADGDARRGKLGAWWAGASSSAEFTTRSSRILSTSSTASTITPSPETPAITRLKKSHTVGPTNNLNDPSSRRNSSSSAFSFITSSVSALSRFTQNANAYAPDDELCNMNIEAALNDVEQPTIKDHATSLLLRFQTAYRTQSAALREVQAECSAERDELAGMTARARHLQARLEDAARRAAEQEEALVAILEELTAEKKMRIECERAAREKGIVLVRRDLNDDQAVAVEEEGDSVLTEDLGADEDQRRRRWIQQAGEAKNGDAGFETDEESYESASIFSRSRSPTLPPPSVSGAASPDASPIQGRLISSLPPPVPPKNNTPLSKARGVQVQQQQQPQRLSAFQKIFKGISGDGEEGAASQGGLVSCSNCRGGDARVAWDTVSLLRDENKGLKQRVAGLETAVEGALDVVNRVGM